MKGIKRVLSAITAFNVAVFILSGLALTASVWAYVDRGVKEAGFELQQAHIDLHMGLRAHCEVRRDAQPRTDAERQMAAGLALESAGNAERWAERALDRGAWLSSDTRTAVAIVRKHASTLRTLYGDAYIAGTIDEKLAERCPGVLASAL
jgi:hypothetical protein